VVCLVWETFSGISSLYGVIQKAREVLEMSVTLHQMKSIT
jgi:hypothetical protein